jgi:hypothetical protein
MFAYVRLMGEKMLNQRVQNARYGEGRTRPNQAHSSQIKMGIGG